MPETTWGFIILSVIIAIAGSYTGLDFLGRTASEKPIKSGLWITAAGITFGLTIYVLHFTSLLSFHLSISAIYNPYISFLALLFSILFSLIAFMVLKRKVNDYLKFIVSGLFIGTGIITRHYIGLAAAHLPSQIPLSFSLLSRSAGLAISASAIGLWLAFKMPHGNFAWLFNKIGGTLLLAFAILGTYFLGFLNSLHFNEDNWATITAEMPISGHVTLSNLLLISGGLIALDVLFLSLLTTWEKYKALEQVQESEARKSGILDSSMDAIITIDYKGKICEWNASAERILGYQR